ncbi:hypothetical protein, partial [Streptomyces sp. NPDC059389]|uniref:hypothetical protein n=1 Tax=Streptomyces sp. NPDC059389 TaxID=3346818 RepID=UPI0036CEA632
MLSMLNVILPGPKSPISDVRCSGSSPPDVAKLEYTTTSQLHAGTIGVPYSTEGTPGVYSGRPKRWAAHRRARTPIVRRPAASRAT